MKGANPSICLSVKRVPARSAVPKWVPLLTSDDMIVWKIIEDICEILTKLSLYHYKCSIKLKFLFIFIKMPQSGVGSMQGKDTGNMPSAVCALSMNKSLDPTPI